MPGSLIFSNLLKPWALLSPSFLQPLDFLSLLGFCFLWSLIHSVLLKAAQFLLLPWLFHPGPWPALKPTAWATGTVTQISQIQFHPAFLTSSLASRSCFWWALTIKRTQAQTSPQCACYSTLGKTLLEQPTLKMFTRSLLLICYQQLKSQTIIQDSQETLTRPTLDLP